MEKYGKYDHWLALKEHTAPLRHNLLADRPELLGTPAM